jgi:hypothetical protein
LHRVEVKDTRGGKTDRPFLPPQRHASTSGKKGIDGKSSRRANRTESDGRITDLRDSRVFQQEARSFRPTRAKQIHALPDPFGPDFFPHHLAMKILRSRFS